jgi:hypothetical protein
LALPPTEQLRRRGFAASFLSCFLPLCHPPKPDSAAPPPAVPPDNTRSRTAASRRHTQGGTSRKTPRLPLTPRRTRRFPMGRSHGQEGQSPCNISQGRCRPLPQCRRRPT